MMGIKGRCVICNTIGKLTSDHVPPQGVVPPQYVEIHRLLPLVSESHELSDDARRHYPSPKFPTLCSICNNQRLGHEYDPHLIRFANAFRSWVNMAFKIGVSLPSEFSVEVQPHRVARAVVGHLLAAEERRDRTAELNDAAISRELRAYFLDPHAPFPRNAAIYVWPYPSDEIVIARWFGMANPGLHDLILGDVLKFFPLAFWVVYFTEQELEFAFAKLPLEDSHALDNTVRLNISLKVVPPPSWPERPRSREIALTNRETTYIARPEERRSA